MLLKQSTAKNLMVFMADSSDHITGKTGLTLTITASKDGAAFASISPTVTDRGSGWYNLALTTSHTDTLGDLAIHITGTGADATDISRQVVLQIPGDVLTANTVQVSGTSQTARDLGASVLLSSGTGTGQLDITSGVVKSNMIQIDGLATNGNNAALKLKTLDIRSDDKNIPSVNIIGALATSGRGGTGLNIIGGAGSSASKGYAVFTSSGSGNGTGYGVIFGAVNGGDTGLLISGASVPAIEIVRSGSNNAVNITGGSGVGEITANIVGSINSLATQAKADVNAEVKDVLETDTQAEPTSPPASTASLKDKIAWLFTLGKNKRTQTATTETVLADDGTTPIATSAKSDTGTTFTRGKFQ